MTKDLLAAKRYAQALFEIAVQLKQDEAIEADLVSLAQALKKSPQISKSLENPALSLEDKQRMMQKMFASQKQSHTDLLVRFLMVLFEKNRFYLIHEIATEFKKVADDSQGQAMAEICTAMPLDSKGQAAISNRLEKMIGRKIFPNYVVDASLIGGVLVKVKNKIIDDSLATKISNIKKELIQTLV